MATLVPEQIVGEVWDAMHPNQWRWADLTSGEKNTWGRPIRNIVRGLLDAGYLIEKAED